MNRSLKFTIICVLCLTILGCVTMPKGFLKPSEGYLAKRQLQMRQYDSNDQEEIIAAVAGVLQDLGFILDESESKLGLVVSSKKADAKHKGKIAGAFILDMLSALGGSSSNCVSQCDAEQLMKASVIVRPSLKDSKTVVRVTFQRIVWNMNKQMSKVETVDEIEIYEKFYNALSKSIFLEAHKI